MANYWIIVERYENWLIDESEGFTRFGLPESKRRLAEQICAGDILITYVSSGKSSFSDARNVETNELEKLGSKGKYSTAFPIALKTSPIVVLPEERWLPAVDFVNNLSFFYYGDWRQTFRTSLKSIPERDGHIIQSALEMRAIEKTAEE